jgi:hypothetical protein
MAWLTGWTYRRAIIIAHSDDGAQADYQLKLLVGESAGASGEQVDCAGHVLSSFNDLRFTTADGETLCPYWIESITGATPNQLAIVWIKIPSIAAHPDDTTIYMYYGNAGASAASSGADTFTFFDDFPGATLDGDKWTPATAAGGTIAIASSIATLQCTSTATSLAQIVSVATCGAISRVRYKFKAYCQADGYGAYIRAFSGVNQNGFWGYYDVSRSRVAGTDQNPSTTSMFGAIYHICDVLRDGINSTVYLDGVLEQATSRAGGTDTTGYFYAARSDSGKAGKILIDWYFHAKYTANEPTWGSFGDEATEPAPTCALSGTILTASVADIVAGGATIILTLDDDTWVTAGATFDAQRQNIIDGLISDGSEAHGWNAEVRDKIPVTDVIRTSDTVVTITLSAAADYAITADETITVIVPATSVTAAAEIEAVPSFTLEAPPPPVAYHIILSATYSEEAPEVNRAFVVGSDAAGGQVSGSAITQADVDLVGERMDAHHNPAVSSGTVAAAVASAMLAKCRLDGRRAEIVIPPHCGLELWDVLAVIDTVANQDTLYRVTGYQLEYDTVKGAYFHHLQLCAP